jgi:acyl-CoA thioester hydrolase
MTLDEFKKQYAHNIERHVEWGDMDSFQHVNNTVYFHYFERIRMDYFRDRKFIDSLANQHIGPILASTHCRFKLPLSYPDTIVIGTYITDLQVDRFLMKYAVFSERHERIAADGDGLIVCYDYDKGEKAPIPEAIFARLESEI